MGERKANRLIDEKSPYLLQHAYNPVDWRPWGEDAFKEAEKHDKPIFLSIGYSTCHWCHVMKRESFTDDQVAALMNDAFINVKVDREERPDVDGVYMAVSQMMTGGGGWPLNIIMTPDRRPFYAATYIPKTSRFGVVGIMDLIPTIKNYWRDQRGRLENIADSVVQGLNAGAVSGAEKLDRETLDTAYSIMSTRFDEVHGGFGDAPKFPAPHNLLFLLRYWKRTGTSEALNMVEKTLHGMRMGGIYDQLGYGFHRYSTDRRWLLPHFEKMLYDQAMHIMAYSEAYQATREPLYRETALEVAAYVLRDLASSEGGFYSAEDADSEGEEGRFYVWGVDELEKALTGDEYRLVAETYGVREEGNFRDEATGTPTGRNILHIQAETPSHGAMDAVEGVTSKLFQIRERRVRPLLDDKILVDWNGLMIAALAYAARALGARELLSEAARAAELILGRMWDGERLLHRIRDGDAAIPGFIDDYAYLAWGLTELYLSSYEPRYLEKALELTDAATDRLWDGEGGGFYFTEENEALPARRKELHDGAKPSGNSVMLLNLLRLSRLTGRPALEEKAGRLAEAFSSTVKGSPHAYTFFLCGLDFALGPSHEVVLAGENPDEVKALYEAIWERYLPNTVVFMRTEESAKLAEYAEEMTAIEGRGTAYVCNGFKCEKPTVDADEMLSHLV
jgi:uncharacterized protein YyaL (SSP411 family)